MTIYEHIHISVDALAELCERYDVQELSLFGSVLRDDFRDDSDIDVLVVFKPDTRRGLFTYAALQQELEELFQRPVDLVPKNGLKPLIRDHVISSSEVLYGT